MTFLVCPYFTQFWVKTTQHCLEYMYHDHTQGSTPALSFKVKLIQVFKDIPVAK